VRFANPKLLLALTLARPDDGLLRLPFAAGARDDAHLDRVGASGRAARSALLSEAYAFRVALRSRCAVGRCVGPSAEFPERFESDDRGKFDIVLSLDISGSMLARDFQPDRISAAKEVAASFIADRPNDRIGLVVFAGESFTQSPLTTDKASLLNILGTVRSGMIDDGTAIGNGLATAVNRLRESQAKSKVSSC